MFLFNNDNDNNNNNNKYIKKQGGRKSKNVSRDCAFSVLRDIFSSFCRPDSCSRPDA